MRSKFLFLLAMAVLLTVVATTTPADAQTLLRTLDTPNPEEGGWFGWSVAVGDVDGDGKADIAVGAPWEDVGDNWDEGRAYVFSGADGSLLFTLNTPNSQEGAEFGYSVGVGDVNGDGKGDIAVGAPEESVGDNIGQGRAYVFSGADGSLLFTLDTPNPQEFAIFGWSVAVGDVNGDGKGDVAVGAPQDQGWAYVFSGADGSLLFTFDAPNPGPDENSHFGNSVAVGDVDSDGKGDIAVGAYFEQVGDNFAQGRAYVFSGASGSILFTLGSPNPQEWGYFGDSVAVGDVDSDGKGDIAVGAGGEDGDAGRAYVFSGASGSRVFTLDSTGTEGNFGWAIAVGDVNGDGKGDIGVGSYRGWGGTSVFSGADGSMLFSLDAVGDSVSVGDVDGDGRGDIAVGASREGEGTGRAYVFSSEIPLAERAAALAQAIVGAGYLGDGSTYGGKGWDCSDGRFVETQEIIDGYHYYYYDYANDKGVCSAGVDDGVDCSGVVFWTYNKAYGATEYQDKGNPVYYEGAHGQYKHNSEDVDEADLAPGDLLFFDWTRDGTIDHVAMYVGPNGDLGDVVESQAPGVGIVWNTKEHLTTPPPSPTPQPFVGFRRVTEPQVEMEIEGLSPIDLVVTDPESFTITKAAREVPDHLYYSEWDMDDDGELDDLVAGPERKMGEYVIHVVPEPGAAPTDTYSILVKAGDQTLWLAQDVPISQIPSAGYRISSTEGGIAEASPVGGIAELPDVAGSASGSSSPPYAALAGAAAGVVALAAGAWYARRRWLR